MGLKAVPLLRKHGRSDFGRTHFCSNSEFIIQGAPKNMKLLQQWGSIVNYALAPVQKLIGCQFVQIVLSPRRPVKLWRLFGQNMEF